VLPGSNRLKKVTDGFSDPDSRLGDFKYASKGVQDSDYDAAGNKIQKTTSAMCGWC
jgi:hypothetical protein